MPFRLKRSVAEVYGTETWLTDKFPALEIMYGKVVRSLLGVRQSTPLDLCLIEAGMQPIKDLIMQRRNSFLAKKIPTLSEEDPLSIALELTRHIQSVQLRQFRACMDYTPVPLEDRIRDLSEYKTRYHTYLDINPELTQHRVYHGYTRDSLRIAYTRFILSSHRLRIETGRWTRPTTLRENRLCDCGLFIQDERHVVSFCDRTRAVRERYSLHHGQSLNDILRDSDTGVLCHFIKDIMDAFD